MEAQKLSKRWQEFLYFNNEWTLVFVFFQGTKRKNNLKIKLRESWQCLFLWICRFYSRHFCNVTYILRKELIASYDLLSIKDVVYSILNFGLCSIRWLAFQSNEIECWIIVPKYCKTKQIPSYILYLKINSEKILSIFNVL